MKYKFHQAVVIGSGTMGAAVAAHLANAGIPVTLLDIVPNKLLPEEEQKGLTLQDKVVRNRIVQQGLDRAVKSRPASFFTPETSALVSIGNLEDDLNVIKKADWVIEAVELSRLIGFYNAGGYAVNPATEDGFAPVTAR